MGENSKSKKTKRHEERELAFILLFEQMVQKDDIESIISDAKDARDVEVTEYTRMLADGVIEKKDEIDKLIESNLKGWKINRISKVSLVIMRVAVYEMLYVDTKLVKVFINEAVELAKEYAASGDSSFVNGVLGSIARNAEKSGGK